MRILLGLLAVAWAIAPAMGQSGDANLAAIENACVVRGAEALPAPAGATITHRSATTVPPRGDGGTLILLRYDVTAVGRTAAYGVRCTVRRDGSMEISGPFVATVP